MTTNNNINEALKIYNYRDWTWQMADDNFSSRCRNAKAEMREFVSLVNTIDDAEVRDALRRMWTLRYKELQASYNDEEFNEEAELDALEKRFAA